MRVVNPSPAFTVDCKRFTMRGTRIESACPKCGEARTFYLGRDDYLGYPRANDPFDHVLYCGECSHEWSVRLLLTVALSVVGEGG